MRGFTFKVMNKWKRFKLFSVNRNTVTMLVSYMDVEDITISGAAYV